MQRLPVNSLNLELLQELSNVFDSLEKDNCKGMILTSVSKLYIHKYHNIFNISFLKRLQV